MRVLVQRSGKAKVTVDEKVVGSIDSGLMLLVGFTEGDDLDAVKHLAKKVVNLRIFPDVNDVMIKSLLDFGGDILSILQFTLYGDARKGNRPSYINALKNDLATPLYDAFNEELRGYGVKVETGVFGADMEISFTNIGPTTILLEK